MSQKENAGDERFHISLVRPEVLQNFKDLTCKICNTLVWDPLSTPCQHIFCSPCIRKTLKSRKKCPKCEKSITSQEELKSLSKANRFAWGVLGSLSVYCPKHRKEGCPWRGPYNQARMHLKECPLENTTCTNCSKSVMRGLLTEHLAQHCPYRILSCNFCKKKISFKNIENHEKECPEKLISCKNNCGAMVQRDLINSHNKICPKAIVSCPLPNHNCRKPLYRDTVNDHVITAALDIVDELVITKKKLSAAIQDLNGIKQDLRNKENELAIVKKDLSAAVHQLCSYKRKLETADNELQQVKRQFQEQINISIVGNEDSSDVGGDVDMQHKSKRASKRQKTGEKKKQSGRIYVIGGDDAEGNDTNSVEYFDIKKQKWKKCASLNTPRFAASAVACGKTKNIYVFGGYGGDRNLATCERYDCVTRSWRNICPMPTPRHGAAITTLNNRIYVIGGRRAKRWLDCVECYTPETNSWHRLASLQQGRAFCGAVTFKKSIYVFGGKISKDVRTDLVERYDLKENKWYLVTPMRKKTSTRAVLVRDLVYCFKGSSCYDPTTDEWSKGPGLPVSNWGGFALTCNKNKIFLLGGKHEGHMELGYAYNTLKKRWDELPTMPTGRRNPAACWIEYS